MKVEEEIKEILAGVIAASKDLYTIANGKGTWKGIPDYYEGYKRPLSNAQGLKHTRR